MTNAAAAVAQGRDSARELARMVKPKLRGWLHLGMAPISLIASIVLVVLAPTDRARIGALIFGLSAVLLFTTSAVYHRGEWTPRVAGVLKRWDHSNIFVIIAGTYTPFALTLLPREQAIQLLLIVWSGALAGVLFRIFWVGAPRWLYVPVYVALGWVAVFYFGPLMEAGGVAVITLIALGGLLYTMGAIVYGTKRPNPSPRWFGFHEVFHAFTVLAFAAHYVAASLAIYTSQAAWV
ncbi:PAQR family membrane homeostasis protein TrhA [Demetria terragena]|uniref:PAQR family membrane homeostasis protein TrhA n=1 Tax=Demetria terragena TaxID=63959 RepID=UPI0003825402|nr:hemolysin III family protein [Demetria terragena]